MKTIHILATLLTMIAALQGQAAKPNVVVIMADDIGLGDLSHYANLAGVEPVVETPNLDRLIAEGMSFTDAHSPASLCAPSRFSMMTGNYSYRNSRPWGVWGAEGSALIDPDFTTVARIAKAGCYHTAFFGKWGLGGSWLSKKQVDYTAEEAGPLSFGFDYAMALPQGIQSHPYAFYENREWVKFKPDSVLATVTHEHAGYEAPKPLGKGKKKSAKHRDYGGIGDSNWDPVLTGPMLVAKAVSYIERQSAEEPFYMYYCSQAVHLPHTPPAELDGVKIAGSTAGVHGDMILELDVQVGMIVKALKAKGLYENTLLIFTSDNGGLSMTRGFNSSLELEGKKGSISEGGHRVPFGDVMAELEDLGIADDTLVIFTSDNGAHEEGGADPEYFDSNGVYKGFKRDLYEGGIHVPMIAVWPGKIRAGSTDAHISAFWDFLPTVADLTDMPLPVAVDGVSYLPTLLGRDDQPAHDYLYWEFAMKGGRKAIRKGQWKGVRYGALKHPDSALELYDLDNDPGETVNLANKFPEIVAELDSLMSEARTDARLEKWNFKPKKQ